MTETPVNPIASINLVSDPEGHDWPPTEICDLECLFAVTLHIDALERVSTVGDLDDVIWRELQARGGNRCMAAMAFYRLRRVLAQNSPKRCVSLSSQIEDFFATPKDLATVLKRETGLIYKWENNFALAGWLLFLFYLPLLFSVFMVIWFLFSENIASYISSVIFLAVFPSALFILIVSAIFNRGKFNKTQTIGSTTRNIINENYTTLITNGGRVTREMLRIEIGRIISVSPRNITQNTIIKFDNAPFSKKIREIKSRRGQ